MPLHSRSSTSYTRSAPSSSSSHYRRRPRPGYISRLIRQIKRLLLELYAYVRRNPAKVLLPVAAALVSGGALHAVARALGFGVPAWLVGAGRGGYEAWGRFGEGKGMGGGKSGGMGMLGTAVRIASGFL